MTVSLVVSAALSAALLVPGATGSAEAGPRDATASPSPRSDAPATGTGQDPGTLPTVLPAQPRFLRSKEPPPSVPAEAGDLDLQALKAMGEGRCSETVELYTKALRIAGDVPSYLFNRGSCLARLGRVEEASADIESAVKLRPALGELAPNPAAFVYATRGGTRLEAGDAKGAAADFREARRHDPENPVLWSEEAIALTMLRDFEGCITAATRALELRPKHAEALANRASCLAYQGRFEQAIRDLDSAIEVAPRAEAFVSRGRMRAMAGDREGAREDARQAVKLDPRARPYVEQLLRDP